MTGHTGFKGTWLTLWLLSLGAKVVGYSLPCVKKSFYKSHFEALALHKKIVHIEGDIRDFSRLKESLLEHQPEIVFHLAAQPIVLHAFSDPKETFDVNSFGTTNLLEAIRLCPSVKAAVLITTDKCYENKEWLWGYRENDRLGGSDPYSASKAMTELAARSYRDSFFKNGPFIATARAGNVIGGGDFSPFRIIADTMKAMMEQKPVAVRNPKSVRPWIHVLEPLYGYLLLGEKLQSEGEAFAQSWNFGPKDPYGITVEALVAKTIELWGEGSWIDASELSPNKEMGLLRLNWDKAAHLLGWEPVTEWTGAIEKTTTWFKNYQHLVKNSEKMFSFSTNCIQEFQNALSTDSIRGILSH